MCLNPYSRNWKSSSLIWTPSVDPEEQEKQNKYCFLPAKIL